jgi:hypothetical protein
MFVLYHVAEERLFVVDPGNNQLKGMCPTASKAVLRDHAFIFWSWWSTLLLYLLCKAKNKPYHYWILFWLYLWNVGEMILQRSDFIGLHCVMHLETELLHTDVTAHRMWQCACALLLWRGGCTSHVTVCACTSPLTEVAAHHMWQSARALLLWQMWLLIVCDSVRVRFSSDRGDCTTHVTVCACTSPLAEVTAQRMWQSARALLLWQRWLHFACDSLRVRFSSDRGGCTSHVTVCLRVPYSSEAQSSFWPLPEVHSASLLKEEDDFYAWN